MRVKVYMHTKVTLLYRISHYIAYFINKTAAEFVK